MLMLGFSLVTPSLCLPTSYHSFLLLPILILPFFVIFFFVFLLPSFNHLLLHPLTALRLFFSGYAAHRALHPFPRRRSSDLRARHPGPRSGGARTRQAFRIWTSGTTVTGRRSSQGAASCIATSRRSRRRVRRRREFNAVFVAREIGRAHV